MQQTLIRLTGLEAAQTRKTPVSGVILGEHHTFVTSSKREYRKRVQCVDSRSQKASQDCKEKAGSWCTVPDRILVSSNDQEFDTMGTIKKITSSFGEQHQGIHCKWGIMSSEEV